MIGILYHHYIPLNFAVSEKKAFRLNCIQVSQVSQVSPVSQVS